MPINFNQGLETKDSGMRPLEKPVADYSDNIISAGKAITNLAEMFNADKSESALGSFSGEIADIENQAIQYQMDYADLVEQLRTAEAQADANVIGDITGKLASLKAGRVQGRLSQPQARLLTNQLIKDYSSQYPALAIKIRGMANESMDNLREVNNEIFGDDPITAASTALLQDALKNNTTPATIAARNNALATSDLTTKELQARKAAGDLDKDTATHGVQIASFESAKARTYDLATGWALAISDGKTITENDAINEIARVKNDFIRQYTGDLIGYGAYSKADLDNALAPAFALFDTLETILKSSGATLEAKVKLAKDLAEYQAANQKQKVFGLQSMLGGIFEYLPENAAFSALQAAAQIEMSRRGGKWNLDQWEDTARAAAVQGDQSLGMGLLILRSDKGPEVVGQIIGSMISGGTPPPGANDPALSAVAKREVDNMLGKTRNAQERSDIASKAIDNFDWIDLSNNPNMRQAIQEDPALLDKAMNKAAAWSSRWLEGIDTSAISVNHKNIESPFTIKGEDKTKYHHSPMSTFTNRRPNYSELEFYPLSDRLNRMYTDILNSYGAAGVDKWLTELGLGATSPHYKKSLPPSDESKKKVTSEERKPAPKEYASIMFNAEKKHNLPSGLLEAVAWEESRYNPNARSEKGALGIMQIMPEYHKTNPLNPSVAIDYAGEYLARLYDRFGDWEKALAAYNWGEGNLAKIAEDPNWFDRLPKETKNYVYNITRG